MNAGERAREDRDEGPLHGVLAVGHGTRWAAGRAEFLRVVEQLTERLAPRPVEPCYLELAEPTIAASVARLRERGARRLVVAPLLLFAAGHARQDIPNAVAEAASASGNLPWTQTAPLGLDPRLIELSQQRYDAAIASAPATADAETLLLLVGRGAADPAAVAEMREFARRRAASRPSVAVEVAFTALAEPLVEAVLPRIAAGPHRRIVVQPHLLFTGQLLERLQAQIAAVAASTPDKQWSVAAHLGPDPAVVEILAERILAACGAIP